MSSGIPIGLTEDVLRGLAYDSNGSLRDTTGHVWHRVRDWVDPDEAEQLVRGGTRFAIQRCLTPPVAERPERFRRDVHAHMVTSAQSESYAEKATISTAMVGELWRSEVAGDLLLFVESAPFPRGAHELEDAW